MFYQILMTAMLLGDAVWWWQADRRLRRMDRGTGWRLAVAAFILLQLVYILRILSMPFTARHNSGTIDVIGLSAAYLWHLLVLPFTFITYLVTHLVKAIIRRSPRRRPVIIHSARVSVGQMEPTRRDVLAGAALALPPLIACGGVTVALAEKNTFRTRRVVIPLKRLPPALDGLTIAHVSDTHVGRFTNDALLQHVADSANALNTDLTLFTGDLIDVALADLKPAIAFARRLRGRHGVYFCEGNHDLIEDVIHKTEVFRSTVRSAGLQLLVDQSQTLTIRGERVQILGAAWSRTAAERKARSLSLMQLIDPQAFSILLSHHPHVWDHVSVPLTLCGHTHGGQLMLNERVGVGPMMFRYWSGLYRRGEDAMFVSNGVGNWFPLRTRAPAEIVHVTLRSARQHRSI